MLNQGTTSSEFDVYEPRSQWASHYFRYVESHFEQLEGLWDDRYANRYGFWRPYGRDVICRTGTSLTHTTY
jgi:hypothetical protein